MMAFISDEMFYSGGDKFVFNCVKSLKCSGMQCTVTAADKKLMRYMWLQNPSVSTFISSARLLSDYGYILLHILRTSIQYFILNNRKSSRN